MSKGVSFPSICISLFGRWAPHTNNLLFIIIVDILPIIQLSGSSLRFAWEVVDGVSALTKMSEV